MSDEACGASPGHLARRDGATNLIYMRHRWYDASLGRFISRDPIGLEGDTNFYRYAFNAPHNLTDSYGESPGKKKIKKKFTFKDSWRKTQHIVDKKCESLADSIKGNREEVYDRLKELWEDRLGLPGAQEGCTHPDGSIESHVDLFNDHMNDLHQALLLYASLCQGHSSWNTTYVPSGYLNSATGSSASSSSPGLTAAVATAVAIVLTAATRRKVTPAQVQKVIQAIGKAA